MARRHVSSERVSGDLHVPDYFFCDGLILAMMWAELWAVRRGRLVDFVSSRLQIYVRVREFRLV